MRIGVEADVGHRIAVARQIRRLLQLRLHDAEAMIAALQQRAQHFRRALMRPLRIARIAPRTAIVPFMRILLPEHPLMHLGQREPVFRHKPRAARRNRAGSRSIPTEAARPPAPAAARGHAGFWRGTQPSWSALCRRHIRFRSTLNGMARMGEEQADLVAVAGRGHGIEGEHGGFPDFRAIAWPFGRGSNESLEWDLFKIVK